MSSPSATVPTLLSIPSRYSATRQYEVQESDNNKVDNSWEAERSAIADRVLLSKERRGEILNMIRGYAKPIRPTHEHFSRAVSFANRFRCPSSIGEFLSWYSFDDLDYVGENTLLLVQLGRIGVPNEFHLFAMGFHAFEYDAEICNKCGLNQGPWCGEYLPLHPCFTAYPSLDDYEENVAYYEAMDENDSFGSSWGEYEEGEVVG